jgi:hypothetical protein
MAITPWLGIKEIRIPKLHQRSSQDSRVCSWFEWVAQVHIHDSKWAQHLYLTNPDCMYTSILSFIHHQPELQISLFYPNAVLPGRLREVYSIRTFSHSDTAIQLSSAPGGLSQGQVSWGRLPGEDILQIWQCLGPMLPGYDEMLPDWQPEFLCVIFSACGRLVRLVLGGHTQHATAAQGTCGGLSSRLLQSQEDRKYQICLANHEVEVCIKFGGAGR